MRIAILGATSQIAKDLILSLAANSQHKLVLYARRPQAVVQWLTQEKLAQRYTAADFAAFTTHEHFDAIMNFVGVGDPAKAAAIGANIFDVTLKYDEMALSYLHQHPTCRYIFLSSGAAYGSSFDKPADANTRATIEINNLRPQDWYGVAKLHAECRHRALAHLPIIDIRVFNYFSHTQDIEARFLITDILRAIRDKTVFKTSSDYIVRDFIHPSDFYQLVSVMLAVPAVNTVFDCFSVAPVDKPTLLQTLESSLGLRYEVDEKASYINGTGIKSNYFSKKSINSAFGYKPNYSSIESIEMEARILLKDKLG